MILIKVESEEHSKAPPKDIVDVEKYLDNSDLQKIPNDLFVDSDDINVWIDPLDATQEYTGFQKAFYVMLL